MKATITSKGQVTIPVAIREKLGLKVGQILDFDETAPLIKAIPVFDEDDLRCGLRGVGAGLCDRIRTSGGPLQIGSFL